MKALDVKVEKEVKVIKNLIRLLNDCKKIAFENNHIEEVESCNRDIETCTRHLNRLLEMREH